MATWTEFAEAAPEISQVGLRLLTKHNLAYLATARRDGSPHVHPVAPIIVDGHLLVSTPPSSPKARDQLRDGRYVLHMLPGDEDDEFWVRGRSVLLTDARLRAQAEAARHWVRPEDCLFEYDIEEAMSAYWENVGQPGTYPVRRWWRAAC
jgi:hypothetical protein